MNEPCDIRDRRRLTHGDIIALNFIRETLPHVFRRHYRQGLRSHIMEVHDRDSVSAEKAGVFQNGVCIYPRSAPLAMFRLFRQRFETVGEVLADIRRFRILKSYVTAEYVGVSTEFVVDYWINERYEVLLCGLQEFVPGEIFDPWLFDQNPAALSHQIKRTLSLQNTPAGIDAFSVNLRRHVSAFVSGLKRLIELAGYIPDLSGVGNLLLTPCARLKLVDINNISSLSSGETAASGGIPLDDKGYPVLDKSVEVLFILESKLLELEDLMDQPLYKTYLTPQRKARVHDLEKAFLRRLREQERTTNTTLNGVSARDSND